MEILQSDDTEMSLYARDISLLRVDLFGPIEAHWCYSLNMEGANTIHPMLTPKTTDKLARSIHNPTFKTYFIQRNAGPKLSCLIMQKSKI